jgi:hypothetical protein
LSNVKTLRLTFFVAIIRQFAKRRQFVERNEPGKGRLTYHVHPGPSRSNFLAQRRYGRGAIHDHIDVERFELDAAADATGLVGR